VSETFKLHQGFLSFSVLIFAVYFPVRGVAQSGSVSRPWGGSVGDIQAPPGFFKLLGSYLCSLFSSSGRGAVW
jgi:hypothetical protein